LPEIVNLTLSFKLEILFVKGVWWTFVRGSILHGNASLLIIHYVSGLVWSVTEQSSPLLSSTIL